MRVQVNLSDDIIAKVDSMAKSYGVPRSTLLSVWIGQIVSGYENVNKAASDAIQESVKVEIQ